MPAGMRRFLMLFDKERDDLLHKRIREYREIYGELPIKFSMNQREEYLRGVPLIGTERPLWDKAEFWRIRMGDIVRADSFNDRINKNVFSKMVYSTSPMFMVRATKLTEEEEAEADIHEHWNGRAPLAGVDSVNEVTGKSESLYRYMKKMIPDEPCRILDVGCGAGGISAFLARDGHDVTGLDLAERMLDEVEYTFDKAGLGRPHTVKADLNRPLSLENGTFDCIILNEVLWTLMKPELAIKECRRLLKPGGIWIIGDSNKYLQELSEESKKAYVERWKPVADDTSSLVYGCDCSKASYIDNIHKMLPLSYKKRPEWDVEELESMGFKLEGKISIEESDIRPERFLLKFKID